MTNPIGDFSRSEVILVTGSNTTEAHPIIANRIRRAVDNGAKLLVIEPRRIPLSHQATLFLQPRPGSDVAWINGLMHVIIKEGLADLGYVKRRCEGFDELSQTVAKYDPDRVSKMTGIPSGDIVEAARLYARGKPSSIAYAMGITQHVTGTDNVKSLANLAMLCGNVGVEGGGVNPLRGQNNVQGACDMGALPNVYPGYQKVTDPAVRQKFENAWGVELSGQIGLTLTEILPAAQKGRVKAIYIMGENPMLSDPDTAHVKEALEATEFLVVQDLFLTETAELADVVLPATSYLERTGTVTNTERRVQRLNKVIEALDGTRPDWRIICDLSTAMGYPMSYASEEEIFCELAQRTPQYGGISYKRLENEELCWPCPAKDHPGTPVLHRHQFSRGQGRFHAIDFLDAHELPDEDYPMVLTTGRVLYQFHTGTMSRKSDVLNMLEPGPFVQVSPQDAERLGITDGETVRVRSRRGLLLLDARVHEMVNQGLLFIPFHFAEAAANVLTNPAHDPTAKIPEFKVCAVCLEKVDS
jgi:formate dehydrogenase alpha subunit